MLRLLLVCFASGLSCAAYAECVATAYLAGSPIPSFVVQATHDLTPYWTRYLATYPDSARMAYTSGYFEPAPLSAQCLVEFLLDGKEDSSDKFILQRPCSEFSAGDSMRLWVYSYCVELFGRDPDFYSTLPFRHARVTNEEAY